MIGEKRKLTKKPLFFKVPARKPLMTRDQPILEDNPKLEHVISKNVVGRMDVVSNNAIAKSKVLPGDAIVKTKRKSMAAAYG